MVGVVDALSHYLEKLAVVKIHKPILHGKEYPKVLPRTDYRQNPKVAIKLIGMVFGNPKEALKGLVLRSLPTLYGSGLFPAENIRLTGNHT
jgi:hypothetical protein